MMPDILLLSRSRSIKVIDINREHVRLAAQVRAVIVNRTFGRPHAGRAAPECGAAGCLFRIHCE